MSKFTHEDRLAFIKSALRGTEWDVPEVPNCAYMVAEYALQQLTKKGDE